MTLYHALRFLRILLCAIALIAVVIFTAIAIDEAELVMRRPNCDECSDITIRADGSEGTQ